MKKCVEEHQAKLRAAEEKMVAVRQQAEEKLAQYVVLTLDTFL